MSTSDDPLADPVSDSLADSLADPLADPRWEQVRAAARVRVPTPPGLVGRVLRSVGGIRGRLTTRPLELPFEGGSLTVTERVVAVLARKLAKEFALAAGGVHVSAVAMESGALEVLVTVRFGVSAGAAADALRRQLTAALADQLGAPPPPVSVHVVDVHPR
ncbi:hypothetical protein [Amycolatopsis sp. H20-H5]|uniref:hypothetical protein n=1 Tax=Amycolatopsis sp. H20-H5 TaxID=3046309 RepID=UPI002DB69623|nr:hypothetical protein [Amycolatopsis sp. H20-H5]MEC3981096.1 hypothetical protein [Amycolatopsis sp. H20-H5]